MLSNIVFSLLLATAVESHAIDKRSAITDCLTKASVPQNLPGSSAFTQAIKPFNLRIPFTPAAVAVPSTVPQVQAAVKCATTNKVPISPKGGGHSYASHGIGGEDGHLVIDMKLFTNVTVDSSSGIAAVGAGGRLGNIAQALYNQGQRAFSHGTCPGVGIGGHLGGGGYGYSSHTKGLALDALVEATVVLADGSVAKVSSTSNPDLFWALRGAGNCFAVITEYKVQTYPAPMAASVYSINYQFSSPAQAAQMHLALTNYANTTMPAEMNMRMFVNSYSFNLEGIYYGSQSAYQNAIKEVTKNIPGSPSSSSVQTMDYIPALNNYAYGPLTTPLNYDVHETFFSKSLMTAYISPAAYTAFWTYWYNTVRTNTHDWYLIIDLHGGPTSAISKVADNATAYAHRGALLKYEFYDRVSTGSYPSNGFSLLNDWVSAITKTMSTTQFGMYLNYADTSLTKQQSQSYYWLGHYNTLTNVKKAYDPNQAFSNPQAVGVTPM